MIEHWVWNGAMSVRYGYVIRWYDITGGKSEASTSGHATPEEARAAGLDFAVSCGWTPRRWWQVWRWGEQ